MSEHIVNGSGTALQTQMEALREKIKQKRKYLEDEPRSIQMSHIGWARLRKAAKKRRIALSSMLEMFADEQAQGLSETELQEADKEAEAIKQRRLASLQELEQQLQQLEQQAQARA